MSTAIRTGRPITVDSVSVEGLDTESRTSFVHFFVVTFLAFSVVTTVTLPEGPDVLVKMARWGSLGIASILVLGRLTRSPLTRQGVAWVLSGLYAAGTVAYSIDVPATVLRSSSYIGLTIAAFAGGSICYRDRSLALRRFPGQIGIMLALLALPSVVGLTLGFPEIFFHEGGLFRGVFVHANTLGAFVSMWLVVGIGVYDSHLTRHRRIVILGLIAMAICAVASKCRAGVGASLIAILFYVLVTRKMRRLFFVGALAVTMLLTAFIALPYVSDVVTRESTDFIFKGGDEDALVSRRDVWDTGWNNFLDSPWLGYGFGTSVGEVTNEWKLVGLGAREKGSAFIAVLEETGLFGGLVLGFPLVLCMANAFRLRRLNLQLASIPSALTSDARLAAAFWAGAMGGIANNLAEATLWSPGSPFGGMLLFLAGAAEGLMLRTESRQ